MEKLLYNPVFYLVLYLAVLNVYGIIVIGIDKRRAIRRKYRIPEKVFFIVALLGGAAGVYAGMKIFHHKTLHKSFKYGIPLLLLLNIILIIYILHLV